MIFGRRGCLVLLVFLFAPGAAHPTFATVRYRVSLDHPERHLFHVTMTVPVEGRELALAMPAWNALYRIRNFGDRVRGVKAICASLTSVPPSVQRADRQDWHIVSRGACAPGDHNTFVMDYAVFWDEPGPFNSQLDRSHAFVNFAEILMYLPGRRGEDVSVELEDLPQGWRIATPLAHGSRENVFVASSYDALIDGPVEVGHFDEFSFESEGVPIHVAVDGKAGAAARLKDDLQRITAYDLRLMGNPPFDSPDRGYTFLIHLGPVPDIGGGGMERRNSSAIAVSLADGAIETAAHEFFHAWNVKRIRPRSLEPVDYSREQRTNALWFAEGVTSTYAAYVLERSGIWSKEHFYRDLAAQIDTLESRPARLRQSVEDSSRDTWLDGSVEYASPARSISYYNKGQILGVLLDLAIRDATDNRKSLDDVMRLMNREYAAKGKYYDESEGVRAAIEEVSGKSFADFFRRYVAGTDEIPYNDFLSIAGLELAPPAGVGGPRSSIVEAAHPTDRQLLIRNGLLSGTTHVSGFLAPVSR